MALLEIKDLSHSFGGLSAVSDFSLEVKAGELVGLIGPNGAGKTTIFTLLMEILRPLGIWRWVVGPLLLVLLMIFRPQGIMGFKEWKWLREEPAGVSSSSK